MRKNDLIKSWKNPEYRNNMNNAPESPIGEALDSNQEELIMGGARGVIAEEEDIAPSEGWVCGISGEVTGRCCNPFTSWF